jgi:hypothetical protein
MSVHKEFSQDLFDECDERAKEIVQRTLKEKGYAITRNHDRYGVDLMDPVNHRYIEVAMMRGWTWTDIFPYKTVLLGGRKKKFVNGKTTFILLNSSCTKAVMIKDSSCTDDRIVEIPNIFVSNGEMYYEIPLSEVEIIDIGAK